MTKITVPRTHLILIALLAAAGWAVFPAPAAAQFADVSYDPIDRHFAPVAAPPDSGTYAPAVQQAIAEGYRQLALAGSPSDDDHLDAAEAAFERALDLDRSATHAWNGAGIYELTKDEQWLVVLESLKKIFDRDHISMAIEAFETSLEIDPGFHAGRYNLALAYRQARGQENYDRAITELERLLAEAPGYADVELLLAITLRDAGELDRLAAMADSLPGGAGLPAAGRQLLLAYALFNTGRPEEGAAAYWKGLDAIQDERQAELYWHDIRPIVTAGTDAEFHRLAAAERPAFIRAFWQGLADASFVTADGRLAEHYRRLHHAYQNFRIALPERRHYASGAAYVPPWQTGFDDRGVIYLRHGPPDEEARYSGPAVEQNVSWKYERAGDPLVFHFVMREDVGDYKLVRRLADALIAGSSKMTGQTLFNPLCGGGGSCDGYDSRIRDSDLEALRELYSSRGSLDSYYDLAATSLDRMTLEREETRIASDVTVGTESQSFDPGADGARLPYPVHAVPFLDPNGGTTIAFYYALPTLAVDIVPRTGGGSQIDYRYQILVTAAGEEAPAARAEEDVAIASSTPIPQQAGVMIPAVRTIAVPPGAYTFGMKVTDLNSGRSGVTRGEFGLTDLTGPELALSGIVLAGRVEPAADASHPLVRWGRIKVLALPSLTFRREQPVFAYYEIYNLAADASGAARYRTTYTLKTAQEDRNVVARFFSAIGELLTEGEEEGEITYVFERSQSGEIDPILEYFSLDVSDSPAGDYVLDIAVEDLTQGTTARREVPLRLID